MEKNNITRSHDQNPFTSSSHVSADEISEIRARYARRSKAGAGSLYRYPLPDVALTSAELDRELEKRGLHFCRHTGITLSCRLTLPKELLDY